MPPLDAVLGCAAQMGFHVANGFGDSLKAPTIEQMRAFLDDLDITDEEQRLVSTAPLRVHQGPAKSFP